MKKADLHQLIREEIQNVLKSKKLNEDFNSNILRKLLRKTSKYGPKIAQAFYNFSKVALDKVEDSDITKMNPQDAYSKLKKQGGDNLVVFYVCENEATNPYAKETYNRTIQAGTLLGVASGNNKFYSVSSAYDKSKASFSSATGDNLGVQKTGSGYGSTGLYNVKRVAEVADTAYVIDLTKLRATKGTKEKIQLRTSQKSGAVAFMTAKQFKEDNMNRYRKILSDKAASGGTEQITKMVQEIIQMVSSAITDAVGSKTMGKYSEIIVGKNTRGQDVTASDAAYFMRSVLDNFERYIRSAEQAATYKTRDGGNHESYYDGQVKTYALELKNQFTYAKNMDYNR